VIEPAKLAELREALEDQRENLRKEIVEQGGDPDSDDAAIDVERGFADSAHSTAERARLLSVMKALRANLRWVGRTTEVLVDRQRPASSHGDGGPRLAGRNRNNKLVHFAGPAELIGRLVNVRVDHAGPYALSGMLDA